MGIKEASGESLSIPPKFLWEERANSWKCLFFPLLGSEDPELSEMEMRPVGLEDVVWDFSSTGEDAGTRE